MRKLAKILLIYLIASAILLTSFHTSVFTSTVEAHSGRTDSSGGHKDNKNKSGLGPYHYHCGGNPPHLHNNGVCPYDKTAIAAPTPKPTLRPSQLLHLNLNRPLRPSQLLRLNRLPHPDQLLHPSHQLRQLQSRQRLSKIKSQHKRPQKKP